MPDEPGPEQLPDKTPDNEETRSRQRSVPKEILDALPDKVRTSTIQEASFSGPLPPSAMFREYDEAMPGSANRLLELTENQQAHRHNWELTALHASISHTKRGQWFGFIVSMVALVAAIVLALMGRTVVGGIMAFISISAIAERLFRQRSD